MSEFSLFHEILDPRNLLRLRYIDYLLNFIFRVLSRDTINFAVIIFKHANFIDVNNC